MARVVCALFVIAACLAPNFAFGYSSLKTDYRVWDLQQQQSPIQLDSNLIYVSGTGIRLANSATSGVAGYYGTDAPFSTNWVVCSWNVDIAPGTGFRTEIRGVNGGTTTRWYEIARQGTIPSGISRRQSDSYGYIDVDTLMLYANWPRIEYRVTLYTNTIGATPTLRLMSICYADQNTLIPYTYTSDPPYTSLAVPWRSQEVSTVDPCCICGPTSMSMAMAYNGAFLSTEYVVTEEEDTLNGQYGNWPFIAQEAAKYGFKSYFYRANNQQPIRDHLAQGYPVEFGMAYSAGQLSNSPISSTPGHLVLVVGLMANGDYICNDPASTSTYYDHVVYNKDQIANVWLNYESTYKRAATVIPCIPNNVYWRYPYFIYKSADPVSIDRAGLMEIFARGIDGHIYRMTQTARNGAWSAWTDMAGTAASDPVTATNKTGGDSVFARFTDGAIYCATQSTATGAWSGWVSLGGSTAGRPAVGKSPDGRLDVFSRMTDGTIQHRWEDGSGGWQAWASLGGSYSSDPVVALNWEGREEVFVRGSDNQLYHNWQRNDGTWAGWSSLGGTLGGDPVMGKKFDGRLEVYCRFADGSIQRNWQTGLVPGTGWNGWTPFGDVTPSDPAIGRLPGTIVMGVGYTQDVFYRDNLGQIWHSYQSATDGAFGTHELLGGAVTSKPPIVGHNDDGRLQVFIVQSDGKIWGKWQLSGGGWSAWTAFGSALFGDTIPPMISSVTVSPTLVCGGDRITVTANVSDNITVASVTAKNVEDLSGEIPLANQGGGVWQGTIYARGNHGLHTVRVTATDGVGNIATDSTGTYTTTGAYAINTGAADDTVTAAFASQYLFTVCGTVTYLNADQLAVDDGSGSPLLVDAPSHGLTNGQHVVVRGVLSTGPLHLDSSTLLIRVMP